MSDLVVATPELLKHWIFDCKKAEVVFALEGEKEVGFNIFIKILVLSMPLKLKIHDVIVVPILAPIIIPTACVSFITPELTKPTTITEVAEGD